MVIFSVKNILSCLPTCLDSIICYGTRNPNFLYHNRVAIAFIITVLKY